MALIRLIDSKHARVCNALVGKRVLELGAGTGLLGLALAAVGSSVLVTDLPQVVNGMIRANIELNRSDRDGGQGAQTNQEKEKSAWWPDAVSVGDGSIAGEALDWTVPIDKQKLPVRTDPFQAEVILAAEAIWLIELVQPFISTALRLMNGPHRPALYLSFIDRAKTESQVFASQEMVIQEFRNEKGCLIEEIHQDSHSSDDGTEHVYRVTLDDSNNNRTNTQATD